MTIYHKFTKDVGIVAISEIVIKFRPIIFLPILTAFLTTSEYGVYASLLVTVSFLLPFGTLGIDSGIIRFLAAEKEKRNISRGFITIFLFASLSTVFIAFLLFLSADLMAKTVFGSPDSVNVIKIASLWVPLQALLGICITFFQMRQKMHIYSVINLANGFLPVMLGAVFLYSGYGLLEFVWSFVIVQTILILIAITAILKDVGISKPNFSLINPYLKFGLPLVLAAFSGSVLNVGDRYVVGLMMGAAAVGIYSVAYTIGSTVTTVLSPISVALLSPASKSYDAGRHNEVKNYLNYSIRYFLMLAIPAAVGLSILSKPLTSSLTNENFLLGSFGVTATIALSTIFYCLFNINSIVLYLEKKVILTVKLLAFFGLLNVLLNIPLVMYFGLFGSALATLVCFIGLFVTSFVLIRGYITPKFDLIFMAKCILSSAIMGLLLYCINPSGWTMILSSIALSAVIYLGVLFCLRSFTRKEISFFRGVFRGGKISKPKTV